jgi:hypothetical protein
MLNAKNLQLCAAVLAFADVAPAGPSCAGCDSSSSDKVVEVPGTATIIGITTAPSREFNCENDPVHISFDFVETGKSEPATGDERDQRLVLESGQNPPRALIERKGVRVGREYECIKLVHSDYYEYYFTTLDLSDYAKDCAKKP